LIFPKKINHKRNKTSLHAGNVKLLKRTKLAYKHVAIRCKTHSKSKNMEKIKNITKGLGLSMLFILLGIYILNTTDSILGTIVGTANICFFGIFIPWTVCRMHKKSRANVE